MPIYKLLTILKTISKERLIMCITKTAKDLGLLLEEFENYCKTRYSVNKDDYQAVYPSQQTIVEKDNKTYVTNLQVMLAQNLYTGSKMIKLADKLSTFLKIPEPPINWYISEKYDGIRAIWDGEKFISRGQKVFTYVPEFFKEIMPPGIALDGEIWISRNNFKEVSRLSTLKIGSSKTQKEIDKIWKGTGNGSNNTSVKFMVYDLPNSKQSFETRMRFLQQIIEDRKKVCEKLEFVECPIRFVEQIKIESMEQLVNTYKTLTAQGAEGVMLRAPNSPYETKRSKYLLKYKIKDDSEAIVIGYTMGTGKYTGLLGSLDCELLMNNKKTGIKFNIGTGLTDKDRTEYNNPKSSSYIPIGSIVSFSYMELSEDSVPRHPVYRGVRDDYYVDEKIEIKNYKEIIIDTFKILIQNEETEQNANWKFKKRAYKQVVDILLSTPEQVDSVSKALTVLRTGGAKFEGEEAYFSKHNEYKNKSIQKIYEIIKTGKLTKVVNVIEGPQALKMKAIDELVKIPEIGPSTAKKLYDLGIDSISSLNIAYSKDTSIINAKQAIGLIYYSDLEKRIPRSEMDDWDKFFVVILNLTINKMKTKPSGVKMELVGSYRRQAESSGDIDILLTSTDVAEGKKLMTNFIKELLKTDNFDSSLVFSSGTTKFMGLGKLDEYFRHVDIFYYSKKEYPFALLFSTGSGQFNVEMRANAIKKGYSLSEKMLMYRNGQSVTSEEYMSDIGKEYPLEEKDIFHFLGLRYIEPKNRKSGMIINR